MKHKLFVLYLILCNIFLFCDRDLKFVINLPHPLNNNLIAVNCHALFKGLNNDVEVLLNRRRLFRYLKPHLLVSSLISFKNKSFRAKRNAFIILNT